MIEIKNILKKLNIEEDFAFYYGKYKAKISSNYLSNLQNKNKGKLVLVTATNPTPFGEGKTTQTIGLSMALNSLGVSSICTLREPSLGPVFGSKGGAIGGGKSCIEPQMDINLHFNGDFHAITSANNLICAIIDNHIFNGNFLNVDTSKICIKRVIDINDRALRNIKISPSGKFDDMSYNTSFELTVASELMAICSLSDSKENLKKNLENMIVAYSKNDTPIFLRDFNCINAVMALLENVLDPNIVQTSENTPCFCHLGPFANIAHGCCSLISNEIAIKSCDVTVTEAGFGADLGAEKFFNICARKSSLCPDICVIVTTVRALKYNGNDNLKEGIKNLEKHIKNMQNFGIPIVVCINKFDDDKDNDILFIQNYCQELNVVSEVSTCFKDGSKGAVLLAKSVMKILDNTSSNKVNYTYDLNDSISEKITKVAKKIYGASNVNLESVIKKIARIENLGYSNLPICIAKTPYSFSDNKLILGCPKDFDITITDIKLNAGAGFIVVYTNNIMTLPGLGKKNRYEDF